jgi:flagellar basal body-associated protein FliL
MISGWFVLMALIAVLVFCALIGVMVWAYSSQSAKRRKNQVGGSTEVRK